MKILGVTPNMEAVEVNPAMNFVENHPERYYTIEETAKALDLCRRTVYNKIHKGRLKVSLEKWQGNIKLRIRGFEILKFHNRTFLD